MMVRRSHRPEAWIDSSERKCDVFFDSIAEYLTGSRRHAVPTKEGDASVSPEISDLGPPQASPHTVLRAGNEPPRGQQGRGGFVIPSHGGPPPNHQHGQRAALLRRKAKLLPSGCLLASRLYSTPARRGIARQKDTFHGCTGKICILCANRGYSPGRKPPHGPEEGKASRAGGLQVAALVLRFPVADAPFRGPFARYDSKRTLFSLY